MGISKGEGSVLIPKGNLVVIGGAEDRGNGKEKKTTIKPLEVLKIFVELISKKDPLIEVITTASSVGNELFEEYKEAFNQLGIKNVGQIHHNKRQELLEDNSVERVLKADGFFFSGGDQLVLTSIYGGTKFLTELKLRYINEKIVIGGTSAGAMAMSTPMIYAGNKNMQAIAGAIKVTTGLEFLKDVCIDTHFVDRSRFIRIAQVIATNPTCIGIGIEEDTAIVVREGNKFKVAGSGVVTVMDGFNITDSNIKDFTDSDPISIRNLRMHLLCRDQEFEIPQVNPPHV